jgi:hypothetical protein
MVLLATHALVLVVKEKLQMEGGKVTLRLS